MSRPGDSPFHTPGTKSISHLASAYVVPSRVRARTFGKMSGEEMRAMQGHRIVQGERTRLRPASWGFSEDELQRRYRWSLDDDLQYWSGTIPGGRTFNQFKDSVG